MILRRLENHPRNAYDDGFLRIDFDKAQVSAGNRICSITPTNQDAAAVHRPCRPLMTYSVLLEALWDMGAQFVDKHALAVNVNRLRGKIENKDTNIYQIFMGWVINGWISGDYHMPDAGDSYGCGSGWRR